MAAIHGVVERRWCKSRNAIACVAAHARNETQRKGYTHLRSAEIAARIVCIASVFQLNFLVPANHRWMVTSNRYCIRCYA